MNDEERRRELIRLVEEDHQRAIDFTARLLTLRSAVQAFAGTVWTAAVSIGVTSDRWEAIAAGGVITLLLAVIDFRYCQHQRLLRAASRRYERALSAYYKLLRRRAGQAQSEAALRRALGRVELGQTYIFAPTNPHNVPLRPRIASWRRRFGGGFDLRVVALLSLVAVSAVLAATTHASDDSKPPVCLRSGGTVVSVELLSVEDGTAEVVPCPE